VSGRFFDAPEERAKFAGVDAVARHEQAHAGIIQHFIHGRLKVARPGHGHGSPSEAGIIAAKHYGIIAAGTLICPSRRLDQSCGHLA
jgi:hypothetical protein